MAERLSGLREPHIELLGYDPYDGLNCPLFSFQVLGGSRLFNMAWIQLLKRSPVNLRPLLGIRRTANPKGLALLLLSHEQRRSAGLTGLPDGTVGEIEKLLASLKDSRYPAWGYGFPWQNRSFYFPRGLANTVVSAFVGLALLKRYTGSGRELYLEQARGIVNFFLNDLQRTELDGGICLSYSALDRSAIINTSLLAAQFLAEYVRCGGERTDIAALLPRLLRFAVSTQRADGSWPYGLAANQQWVDSFHTGYNLCAMQAILEIVPDTAAESSLQKGCAFYETRFFADDGRAFYYADGTGPVDIHSIAQAIITFNRLRDRCRRADELKDRLVDWTMRHMWNERRRAYAFQRHGCYTNRIDYNRWAQAWMHYAQAVELAHAH